MSPRVEEFLDSLTAYERHQLFTVLLRDHFTAGESEVEVNDVDGAIIGYLTSPGIRLAHLLNLDARNIPPELAGPHYPAGHARRMLEQLAAAGNSAPASP
jgi:hypothetical protein